jgi:OmpA-OmpF porin, OOP family
MKYFIILLLIAVVPAAGHAQFKGLLNKAKEKFEKKATSRLDKKIDASIDDALDDIEGKKPAGTASTSAEPVTKDAGLKSYAKYDFVPGEQIIYTNDFAADAMGELPIGWNTNGTGAVVTIKGLNGNWAQLNQNSVFLTDNKTEFTENFTVEFDLVLRRTNPKAPFATMEFGILSSGTYDPAATELLKGYTTNFATQLRMQPSDNGSSTLHLQIYDDSKKYLTTDIKTVASLDKMYNQVIHVAMQVQKERLRIWFNETKLYDLPKAIVLGKPINQIYFDVKRYGGDDAEVGYTVSNIKIAKGVPDTRHKLVEEGKFSTTGILFDVNSASIKPESNGVLKEIADVLKKYPGIKVNIVGHTDSDGGDAANLELSKKRAAAVKDALAKDFSIDASRLNSDGQGEAAPVADNKTKEGKAQNRRVEFIKQ